MRFYVLFVFILTWFIFEKFGGRTKEYEDGLKNGTIPFFRGLFGFFAFVSFEFSLSNEESTREKDLA